MANYHFCAQLISRKKGRSSVASAAYRAGEKIQDERTGIVHDFARKSDVLQTTILLPDKAPSWMAERSVLWNAVELSEKRKDAQTAREIEISLPIEFTQAQNWDLILSFVQKEFVARGMVADVAMHRGGTLKEPQPHAHVMLTMREVNDKGFGLKARSWNHKDLLLSWRAHWASHCNTRYAELGFDLRIDHRSLEDQGIFLEPQNKRGAVEAAQEKLSRVKAHLEIARRNGEKLLVDPSIALYAITRQQSTFTHHDIARFVNRHSADQAQFSEVYVKILASKELVYLGQDGKGAQRFTTKAQYQLESEMMAQAESLAHRHSHKVAPKLVATVKAKHTLNNEQTVALEHVTTGADLSCVIGYAGSGKSYFLKAAREVLEAEGLRMQGVALSGIAAQNLEASSGITSRTFASRQWYWERDREHLSAKDVIVLDEAGMLSSEQMALLIREVERGKAKLILVGDPEQLQAINAGAAFRGLVERVGAAQLNQILRQREIWQQEATRDLAQKETARALESYLNNGYVHSYPDKAKAMSSLLEAWDEGRGAGAGENSIILAYTNESVKALNEMARTLRKEQGELGEDCLVQTAEGLRTLSTGDRVYFLKGDNQLGVKNGTLGTIEAIEEDGCLRVRLDVIGNEEGRRVISFRTTQYNDIDLGYAATIHKAQGVTVDNAYVLLSRHFDRHVTYVALSRHRETMQAYYTTDEFSTFKDLSRALSSYHNKEFSLDYERDETAYHLCHFLNTAHDEALFSPGSQFVPTSPNDNQKIEAGMKKVDAYSEKLLKEEGALLSPAGAKLALEKITRQQSTFTHYDLACFVNKYTRNGNEFNKLYTDILLQDNCVYVGQDDEGRQRFSTQKMVAIEKEMMESVRHKVQENQYALNPLWVEGACMGRQLSGEQIVALKRITEGQDLECIVGRAGTGKSYLLGAGNEAWQWAGYGVQGVTLSGIAAENLEAGSQIKSYTIANRLWHWREGRDLLTDKDVVVVDEAGMLGSEQMAALLREVNKRGAKLVLVGDPEQLQAINAGSAFRAIADETGFADMEFVRRQKEAWQREATLQLASQKTIEALQTYHRAGHIHAEDDPFSKLMGTWDEARLGAPTKSHLMLAYSKREVAELNYAAHARLEENGELGEMVEIETAKGKCTMAMGERIYFQKNDNHVLKIKNGTMGTIEAIDEDKLTVRLEGQVETSQPTQADILPLFPNEGPEERRITFNVADYNYIDYGYATTLHKSQGMTVDNAYVLAGINFNRHTSYVALTRHKERVEVFYNKKRFEHVENLFSTMSREKLKDMTTDYGAVQKSASDALSLGAMLAAARDDILNEDIDENNYYAKKEWFQAQDAIQFLLEENVNVIEAESNQLMHFGAQENEKDSIKKVEPDNSLGVVSKEEAEEMQPQGNKAYSDNFVESEQSFVGAENSLDDAHLDAKIETLLNDATAMTYADKAIKEYAAVAIIDGLKAYEAGELTPAEEKALLEQMTAALGDNDIMLELFIRSPDTEEKMHHFIAAHEKQAILSKSLARGVDKDEDLDISW